MNNTAMNMNKINSQQMSSKVSSIGNIGNTSNKVIPIKAGKIKSLEISPEIKYKIYRPLDPRVILTKGGNNGARYISSATCVDMLNDIFGFMWDFYIEDQWMEKGKPYLAKPNKYNKVAEATVEEQGDVAWVKVKLVVYVTDNNGNIFPITKMACGGQAITGKQDQQANNAYKGAQSIALKKAASLLGIGLQLWREKPDKPAIKDQEVFNENYERFISNLPIVWTEEVIAEHKIQYDKLNNMLKENGLTFMDIGSMVNYITNGYTSDFYKMPIDYMDTLIYEVEIGLKGNSEENNEEMAQEA